MATLKDLISKNYDFFGLDLVDTDADGSKEDLRVTYTNAVDNIAVADASGNTLFLADMVSQHGTIFNIDSNGNLVLEVK